MAHHGLIDVEFYHCNSNILFPKKVKICGFVNSSKKIMTLEVVYPYPSCEDSDDRYRSTDDCDGYKSNIKFGDICIHNINESLNKTLSHFDVVITDNDAVKQFVNQHFPDRSILMLEKNFK